MAGLAAAGALGGSATGSVAGSTAGSAAAGGVATCTIGKLTGDGGVVTLKTKKPCATAAEVSVTVTRTTICPRSLPCGVAVKVC